MNQTERDLGKTKDQLAKAQEDLRASRAETQRVVHTLESVQRDRDALDEQITLLVDEVQVQKQEARKVAEERDAALAVLATLESQTLTRKR